MLKKTLLTTMLFLLTAGWFMIPQSAQAATCTSQGDGNWSEISWNCTPNSADDVVIAHNVTLDQDVEVRGIAINNGATFNNGSFTLTANAGYLTNDGTYNGDSGTYSFTALNGVYGSSLTTFNNVVISQGVNFFGGSQRAAINGRLTINAGGFVNNNGPTYNDGSILQYDTGGTYGRGLEWQSGSSGAGVPYHVEVSAGTTLNINGQRTTRGNMAIAGTVNLGSSFGDDLAIGGNFVNNGTFNHNNRLVTLTGSPTAISGSSATTFAFLTIANTADVTIPTNTTVLATGFVNNGTIRQERTVNAPVSFLNLGGYGGVLFNTTNNLGNTWVVIRGNQDCDTNNSAVRRCFDIDPEFNVATDITFFYTNAEINDGNCATMNVYRWMGTGWQVTTTGSTSCASDPRSVTITGQTGFSPFALRSGGSAPTAVTMQNLDTNAPAVSLVPFILLLLLTVATGGILLTQRSNQTN